MQTTADDLLGHFVRGLHEQKLSHHMTINYHMIVTSDQAEVWAQGYAWNRLLQYQGGSDLWEIWGTYQLTFERKAQGGRIKRLRYTVKYYHGNEYVRTHIRE